MPRFTFEGFTIGSAVAIAAAQGGAVADGSVAAWGEEMASLDILVDRSGVDAAPAPVWFEAIDIAGFISDGGPGPGEVRDPSFHDILYIWDFGDAASASPLYALNMPDAWKNRNIAYGKRVAHVYAAPGTYTASVFAIEMATGRTASAHVETTISDPKVTFADAATIIYDPDNVASALIAAQYPLAQVVTSIAAMESARFTSRNFDMLILLAPGVQITEVINEREPMGNYANLRIGALDPGGTRPVIGPPPGDTQPIHINRDGGSEHVFYGIDFRGGWDSTTETGVNQTAWKNFRQSGMTGDHLTFAHDCSFDGFSSVNVVSGGDANRFCLNDVSITNWGNFAVFSNVISDDVAIIATSMSQHPEALNGRDVSKSGFYNDHSVFRDSESRNVFLSVVHAFGRSGWSGADNGTLRFNTNNAAGVRYVVDRLALEGMIETKAANPGPQANSAGNYLFDKVIQVLGNKHYAPSFSLNMGSATVRNYLGVGLDLPNASWTSLIHAINDGQEQTNIDAPIDIYSSSFLDLRSSANTGYDFEAVKITGLGDWPAAFNNLTIENNVEYAPYRTTPTDADGPLDLTTDIGMTALYAGYRVGFDLLTYTMPSDLAPGASMTIPYSEFTEELIDGTGPATATDQAYWQAIEATDTRHKIRVVRSNGQGPVLHSEFGEFAVSYDAGGVTITNTDPAGLAWVASTPIKLKLDRSSLIPAMDTAFSSLGLTVPLARPLAGAGGIDGATQGLRAYDDLLGAVRPSSGDEKGALLAE